MSATAPPLTIVITPAVGSAGVDNDAVVSSTTTDVNGANNSASGFDDVIGGSPRSDRSARELRRRGRAWGSRPRSPAHPGSTYAWTLTGGTITGGQGTAQITFDAGAPGITMTLEVDRVGRRPATPPPRERARCRSTSSTCLPRHPFHDFVATIARNGITVGCQDGTHLLPRRAQHARPDGGLPAEEQVRPQPRAASGHRRRLRRRPARATSRRPGSRSSRRSESPAAATPTATARTRP